MNARFTSRRAARFGYAIQSILLFATIVALLVGCAAGPAQSTVSKPVTGSGKLVEKEYPIVDFTGVNAAGGFQVEVRHGTTFAVRVTTDDNAVPYLKVEKSGSVLILGLQQGSYNNVTLRAKITMPSAAEVMASGGSRVALSGFSLSAYSNESFRADGSGGSKIEGDVAGRKVRVELSGGSQATLEGATERLELVTSGGSMARLADLTAKDAEVNLSGGGESVVTVSGRIDAKVDGGAVLTYSGNPVFGRNEVAGGVVKKR